MPSTIFAGVLEIVKAAGYKGLLIVIDEAETILRMRSDSRHKSLTASAKSPMPLAHTRDSSGSSRARLSFSTLGTASPVSAPLHERIPLPEAGSFASPRQAQLELLPFDAERLRCGRLYACGNSFPPADAWRTRTARSARNLWSRLVARVTAGFSGDVGVVPRQFLREFVTQMDLVEEQPTLRSYDRIRLCPAELESLRKQQILTAAPTVTRADDDDVHVPAGGRLVSVFARFSPRLQQAIVARLGWSSFRPVQEEAGLAILDGRQCGRPGSNGRRQDRGIDLSGDLWAGRRAPWWSGRALYCTHQGAAE